MPEALRERSEMAEALKQLISDVPHEIETKRDAAVEMEVAIVKPSKRRKKKNPETPQIVKSGDEHNQVSSVVPSEVETERQDAERLVALVKKSKKGNKIEDCEGAEEETEIEILKRALKTTLKIKSKKRKKISEHKNESKPPNKRIKKEKDVEPTSKGKIRLARKDRERPGDEAFRARIIEQLNEFSKSSKNGYIFDEHLGKHERSLVHQLCMKMGFLSEGCGYGDGRRVIVFEGKSRGYDSRKVNSILGSLKFSKKSKQVIRNLFMQYPPGQKEHKKLKSDGCRKVGEKKENGFFCKPTMNRAEIAKKVKTLSFKIKNDVKLKKINEQRSRLPITSSRDVILSEIESNQVILISGETGCGKTTQVPQFLLDKMWKAGQACKILCTQPRRISATSVAGRVAQERGEVVGKTVGYKIRMESQGDRESSLVFCTNGILLKLLVSDGLAVSDPSSSSAAASSNLSQLTHILVDEIHERDHYCDFMLTVLRDMLPRYPHLRLVLMSATMDAEKFSQYFGDCPIIRVPGFIYPVKTFYLEDVLSIVESAGINHTDATVPSSSSSEHHELTDENKTASSISLGADCHLNAQDGTTALDCAECSISRNRPYRASVNPQKIDIVLIEQLLVRICTDSDCGAILVFLPGWGDISKTKKRLLANPFFTDPYKFLILPLHSLVASDEQRKVFDRPPPGCRKIVLSTNIAESSVTIDDVVYVVDSGRLKEKSYDPQNNVSTLKTSWVSKASARQRAGRAGRCQPGVCYKLYSELQAVSFAEFLTPEIRRIPLEELCLQVKMLDPSYDIVTFLNKTMDPPAYETVRNAVALLKDIGALSDDENLTELGEKLGSLPVHPLISKMLFFAILFNCLDPALTLACAAYYREPFILPMEPREKLKASKAKTKLADLLGGHSDQFAVVAAVEGWQNSNNKKKFCARYFLSSSSLFMLSNMRNQLKRELELHGYIPNDISTYNTNAHDHGILHALLLAGFYPRVGRVHPPCRRSQSHAFHLETASGDRILVHMPSANALLPLKQSNALAVYGEILEGDAGLQVKKCSLIGEIPLALLASDIAVASQPVDGEEETKSEITDEGKVMSSAESPANVIVDRWLQYKSTALEAAQIYCLRERLADAIIFTATKPMFILPPALAASVGAIAFIFSHDGRIKITLRGGTETKGSRPLNRPRYGSQRHPIPVGTPTRTISAQGTIDGSQPLNRAGYGSQRRPIPVGTPTRTISAQGTIDGSQPLIREGYVSQRRPIPVGTPTRTISAQGTIDGSQPLNQSGNSTQGGRYVTESGQVNMCTVSEGKVYVTNSSNESIPSLPPAGPAQPNQSSPPIRRYGNRSSNQSSLPRRRTVPSRLPMQPPCPPVSLVGFGAGVFGPYGPIQR